MSEKELEILKSDVEVNRKKLSALLNHLKLEIVEEDYIDKEHYFSGGLFPSIYSKKVIKQRYIVKKIENK